MTEVLKQTYLIKSPPVSEGGSTGVKSWKKRWFILRKDLGKHSLQYFESESSAASGQSPKGTILLQDCTCIHADMKHPKHRNVFAVVIPTRTYYLSAESQMEMEQWTKLLCQILGFAMGQVMTLARSTAADSLSPVIVADQSRSTFTPVARSLTQSASATTVPQPAPRTAMRRARSQTSGDLGAVPLAAGTGAATLRRSGVDASGAAECYVNREVFVHVEKRFAMRSVAFVDALDGVWISGWSHNVPALSGVFKFGDQVLRVAGKPVATAEEANRGLDCFSGSGEIEILVLRTPWAMEVEITRRSRSEPLGVTLKENKIICVKANGAAAQCGMSGEAVGLTSDLVPWIVTEVSGRPVSLQPKTKDETLKLMHAAGMSVMLLLHPEDFVKVLFKQLKSMKNYQQFMP